MWSSLINFIAPEPTPEDLLFSSLQHGKTDVLEEWFTSRGVDALKSLKYGDSDMSVLHVACYFGNMQAVLRLLEYFPFDTVTRGGNTCCHLAAINGHSDVVNCLIRRGASPGVKNFKRENVFDVAQGLQLRQTLMTLVLEEEQRTGTAPVIAGATRDMTRHQERLKNLPPPPTTFSGLSPMPTEPTAAAYAPSYSRPVQPDGFVTTVGNPNLAAKYGNQTQSRLAEPGQSVLNSPPAWSPPTYHLAPVVPNSSRYVVNTPGVSVLPPTRPGPNQTSFRAPTGPYANKVNVFNPAATAGAGESNNGK